MKIRLLPFDGSREDIFEACYITKEEMFQAIEFSVGIHRKRIALPKLLRITSVLVALEVLIRTVHKLDAVTTLLNAIISAYAIKHSPELSIIQVIERGIVNMIETELVAEPVDDFLYSVIASIMRDYILKNVDIVELIQKLDFGSSWRH